MAKNNQRRRRFAFDSLEPRRFLTVGSSIVVPPNPEIITNINPAWKFALNPSGTPQSTGFNDASWATVALPHTWDGSATNDQFGNGWYRKTVNISNAIIGDEIYLQFQGANVITTVFVDGVKVGSHNGGWETFNIDVTPQMTAGNHLIVVDVNNNGSDNVIPTPSGGDYTKQGGLYRSVSIVAVNKTHVALTEPVPAADQSASLVAGSGVYFSNSAVTIGATSANIQINTLLDNLSASSAPVTVTSYLVDAAGIIRSQQSANVTLTAGQTDLSVPLSDTLANPHLWNGRADPYLYDLYVQVQDSSGNVLDLNHQQVGIRSLAINAQTGFFLNGQPYKLVGVNLHQDTAVTGINGGPAGWAQTDAQQQNDLNMVLNTGATMVRTAHYQRDAAFYNYCDQTGLLVETEFGLNNNITSTNAFTNNADDMLTEMIRQNFNHPSIVAWSLYNEIGSSTSNGNFIATLNSLAHSLDTTGRYTIVESHAGSATDGINANADVDAQHPYDGWYGGDPGNISGFLNSFHNAQPNQPIAANEFGAGGSAYQYTNNVQIPMPITTAVYHPANGQTAIEEAMYASISSQQYVFSKLVWTMFDFASSVRNEGDSSGVNDKGLVTRDRSTIKDIYYFYQANWNNPTSTRGYSTTPVVYISDHSWTDRNGSSSVPVTVFSNLGAPTLTINGGAPITMTQQVVDGLTIPDAYTANITLAAGINNIQAAAAFNGQSFTNSVAWTYHAAALAGTSYAHINFTNSTANLQSGYAPDTGQAFAAQTNGNTYGWVDQNGNPAANNSGTYFRTGNTSAPYNTTAAQTGIILNPGNVWQYQLPNGTYDIHIVGSDSATSNLVDNLQLNGVTLHATSFSTSGGTYQEFFATVTVTNNLLTLTGGPGMTLSIGGTPTTQGRLSSIDINTLTTTNSAPTIANPATASPSPVTGTTTALTVLGADANGEATLTYTWITTGTPPAPVTFSANGSNAAKNTTATFTRIGTYSFQVTITNSSGLSVTSSVTVSVNQTVTTITLSPLPNGLYAGASHQFAATAFDQFGAPFTTPPTFSWSFLSDGGTYTDTGLFTAPIQGTTVYVKVFIGDVYQFQSFQTTSALPGDANLDGTVNLSDLNTVLNNLGMTTSAWTDGNFDGAPTIDLDDFDTVLNNLGQSIPAPSVTTTSPLTPSTTPTPTPTPTPVPPTTPTLTPITPTPPITTPVPAPVVQTPTPPPHPRTILRKHHPKHHINPLKPST